MTVGELKNVLQAFGDDAEVGTVRVISATRRTYEPLDKVYSGISFADYDNEFNGKVIIW